MDIVRDETIDDAITRAVGDELRRVRDQVGWTRGQVVARMPTEISIQALANYEYGTRPLTVPRLVKICKALGISAPEVLGLALQRAELEWYSVVHIDLNAVVRDKRSELRPLRRWARHRLADDPSGPGVARLDRAIIEEMAAFFGYTRSEFIKHLVMFAPQSAPRRGSTSAEWPPVH